MIAILLFEFFRPPVAAALTFLGASMFLPSAIGIDPPVLPSMGKEEFASAGCLIGMLLFARPQLQRARIGRGPEILVLGMVVGSVLSVLTNLDPLRIGPEVVPGARATDFVADALLQALRWGVPFVAGRALFTRARDVRSLLRILVVAGLVYSLLIFVELRMSPQLHRWVYGYHQHSFHQAIRASGYRPMVFMRHGLHVALFICLGLLAASTLWRMRLALFGLPAALVAGYLGVVLALCKSVGSLVYALVAAPLIFLGSARVQTLAASAVAALVLAYPLLRSFDLLPLDTAVAVARRAAGPERARSFEGRLANEAAVLERARERLWFGWSSSGRSLVRDPVSGRVETTFDGYWIIALGGGGLVRFVCVFGMVLLPIFGGARALPQLRAARERQLVGGLSLLVAVSMFDLLPNSTVEGYMTLFSGALAGLVPGLLGEQRRNGSPDGPRPPRRQSRVSPARRALAERTPEP